MVAGRHLQNRSLKVTALLVGYERDEDLLEEMKIQAEAYTKSGGRLCKPVDLITAIKAGTFRPGIVIDAMLGMHLGVDDLGAEQQARYRELIDQISRIDASVVAVEVPSGVDASSGEAGTSQGASMTLRPHAVVWLGAPKPWLLASLSDFKPGQIPQLLFVVDIGVTPLWKQLGKRGRGGIDFGTEWVVRVRIQDEAE